ncbi:lactoylglutathione lyase family protein [Cyanobium sp. Copco_Reservoir_LC18]|jgi:predicted enzyme related to lactoylglutathione lyase|uniref:VOC family protein n=1 Tax=Cyanobium sp. Copco_Reservoir_LC18 TaxID=1328305 RepID=UPI0013577147|nr:VOC family protein [Cyanobium sp. Copco_Reservoir_LC18]KAF0654010.1 lactoylglutathione lyase family protein [Cyanobium sp. Copco_Reservoir_LC18]
MAVNPVIWFEIYVDDMARARAFYEAVFQLTLEPLPDAGMEYLTFPMDNGTVGAGGALAKMEGMAPGGGGSLIYFHCDDCAVEEGRVAAAGGTVIKPKMSIGAYGFMSLVLDTEGNTIGLHSQA